MMCTINKLTIPFLCFINSGGSTFHQNILHEIKKHLRHENYENVSP